MTIIKEISYNNETVLSIGVDESDGSVVIADKNANTIRLGRNGISLTSNADIKISTSGDINIEGMNVSLNAKIGIAATGTATAELSASGQTTVKGGMVMIN